MSQNQQRIWLTNVNESLAAIEIEERRRKYNKDRNIQQGEPKETRQYTKEELSKRFGMVGIYEIRTIHGH